ncbi:helicase-related protein [Crenobacter intestini]|uniref:Helicase C-terminal domain-containing protein n=1 Tax=Crenobacter intestini TaxID=2563443 RepID=A0A4V4N7E8_9NEIS|nr:helicase-related protein [Crenobacter intestini]TIC80333.1 hypothetical protein E5K04_12575 [Crenobacter intestini]
MKARGLIPEVWADRLARATDGYKKFQLDTVDTVVRAMFEDDQRRFLVADEVGLGKTKIARALVAETVKRLWDDKDVDRIDVVYICSNAQIARQNLQDLDLFSELGQAPRRADRLTMLPATLADLGHVNLIALTPGTSFDLGDQAGRVGERAMLWRLLERDEVGWADLLRKRKHSDRIFQGWASEARFTRELDSLVDFEPPKAVVEALAQRLQQERLRDELDQISDGRRGYDRSVANRFIGQLRRILAEVCIKQLSPDLIILDEFQRFTNLVHGDGPDGALAKLLLTSPTARVLLLSATPYKMLTTAEDDESHFEQFLSTVRFLLGEDRVCDLSTLRSSLGELRSGILGHRDPVRLAAARDSIQKILGSVMVRSERLAATLNRDGMLDVGIDATCAVQKSDVDSFVATDQIAQKLDRVPSMVEYWKSAPYLYNFMDEYAAKKRIRAALPQDSTLRSSLVGDHMLTAGAIDSFKEVDPRNSRLRWMLNDLDAAGAFDVLWIPPALPQTKLYGSYAAATTLTKRLVFSNWSVVPKSVASLLSYEFERRHHRQTTYENSRKNTYRPLEPPPLGKGGSERFTSLSLLLPCKVLAEIGDPIAIARSTGATLPLALTSMRKQVSSEIDSRLAPLFKQTPTKGISHNIWYAAAQLWLDREMASLSVADWVGGSHQGMSDHWSRLVRSLDDPAAWGPPPKDLIAKLTDIAIAGPAACALRSLSRLRGRFTVELTDKALRGAAAGVSWAFASFFHNPEALQIIRNSGQAQQDDWERLLTHCAEGGLGSTLDEWLHLVPDQCRLGRGSEEPLAKIVETIKAVLHLDAGRATSDCYDDVLETGDATQVRFRTHFAMRFGQAKGSTAEGENPVDVRSAFNSPFRPFVLISTSVGQEGLDFHHYAHAIVHWNLPGNPVDLEQREGRVHRYKNHAVRKNIGAAFGSDRRIIESDDPWRTIFTLADDGEGGMRPEWIFDGDAKIQRLVPLLPMSRDVSKLKQLVEATSLYRMTIGQPRQAELLKVLTELSGAEQEAVRQAVSIDLSPRCHRSKE